MQEMVRYMARLSEGGRKENVDLQVSSLVEKMFLSSSLGDTSRKANKVTMNLPKQDPVPFTHYAIF